MMIVWDIKIKLLDGWQLSGRIVTRAARRALPACLAVVVGNTGYGQNAFLPGCGPEQWAEKWVGRTVVHPCMEEGPASPSNTVSPGPRRTSVPTGILMHSAVWPQ